MQNELFSILREGLRFHTALEFNSQMYAAKEQKME